MLPRLDKPLRHGVFLVARLDEPLWDGHFLCSVPVVLVLVFSAPGDFFVDEQFEVFSAIGEWREGENPPSFFI